MDEKTPAYCRPIDAVAPLAPYDAVSSLDIISSEPGQPPYKLDWNEATIGPSPLVGEALARAVRSPMYLAWYPDVTARRLRRALSEYTGADPDEILVTNGSDDALALLCRTFLDASKALLAPVPTYTHTLLFARATGARLVSFQPRDVFETDTDRLAATIRELQPRLVYLVSPNNPTGVQYSAEEVATLADACTDALLIVDEAYVEFSGSSVLPERARRDNVVVTRTFSKAWGLAGLRVGYLVGALPVLDALRRLHNPKSVTVLGQVAAEAALTDREWLAQHVASVEAAKSMLSVFFQSRGLDVRMTGANFACIRLPNAPGFVEACERDHIFIRDRSTLPGMEGYVRITIPTREQTGALVDRLARILDRLGLRAPTSPTEA